MGSVTPKEPPVLEPSRLLAKMRRAGLAVPLDLERLAIARGCYYYARCLPSREPISKDVAFCNAEVAIALVAPALHPSAREIRLAAALLGSPGIHAEEVALLAVEENCVEIIRHIALSGCQFEPTNSFWQKLVHLLPVEAALSDKMPHPTRFVEMTGIDRKKIGTTMRWIRPR